MPNKKQNFLQGALILTAATIIVKIIGAAFKIPLMNLIGGDGFGYYNTAYQVFNPLYSLATAGMPVAVARIVSESVVMGRYRDVRKILNISMYCFLVTGTVGSLFMLFGARFLAEDVIHNAGGMYSIAVLSPAVFFFCIMSAYRGYYEGLRNMYPTAVSQITEALVKLAAGLGLAVLVKELGMRQFDETGAITGVKLAEGATRDEALLGLMPYVAAAAIGGVMLSTMFGMIYLMIRHRRVGDGISEEELFEAPPAAPGKVLLKKLVRIAIPICMAAMAMNLTSLIDLVSLINRITYAIRLSPETIMGMYGELLPAGMTLEGVPNYLYGVYSGMPQTLFALVPAITIALATAALPNVAATWANNRRRIKASIDMVLKTTTLIAMPAGLGLSVLAEEILQLLYPARQLEIEIATPMLKVMGIAVIFVSVVLPMNSILQGIGKENLPLVFMLVGAVFKLGINYVFVGIPEYNINAAPYGTLACYAVIMLLGLAAIRRHAHVRINVLDVFIKPCLAAAICVAAAKLSCNVLSSAVGGRMSTVIGLCVAVVVYGLVMLLIKGVSKSELKMLPKGEQIIKILEKSHLMR